jgi:hypothetical protein
MILSIEGPDAPRAAAGAKALGVELAKDPDIAWVRGGVDEATQKAAYDVYFGRRTYFASDRPGGTSPAPPERRHVPGSAGALSPPGGRNDERTSPRSTTPPSADVPSAPPESVRDDEQLSALPSAEPDDGTSAVPSAGQRASLSRPAGSVEATSGENRGARMGIPAIVAIALVFCVVVAMIAAAAK